MTVADDDIAVAALWPKMRTANRLMEKCEGRIVKVLEVKEPGRSTQPWVQEHSLDIKALVRPQD